MGEHYGCVGWEGAASAEDANRNTRLVNRPRWEEQEVWQKLDLHHELAQQPRPGRMLRADCE